MNMMLDPELQLWLLKKAFPKTKKNQAVTDNIPIEFFEMYESEIRQMMKYHKLKTIYRGSRISNNCKGQPSMTKRCDATSVLLYRK